MELGQEQMQELGNLYTGALPAWLAAGLEEAATENQSLDDELLLIGYGSGDAAEAIPIHLVAGWQDAARKPILQPQWRPIDLTESQYTALRNGQANPELSYQPHAEFIVDRVGSMHEDDFQDTGIEYYRFVN